MRNTFWAVATTLALALPALAKSSAAEVQCTDGTTGKAGRGACSHHGGVGKATAQPAAKAPAAPAASAPTARQKAGPEAKPESTNARPQSNGGVLGGIFGRRNTSDSPRSSTREAPAGQSGKVPMATCKDGTTSYSAHHSGTCSGHGGVRQWLDQ